MDEGAFQFVVSRRRRNPLCGWKIRCKSNSGIRRDKNDRTDSRDIALYALRYRGRAKCRQLPEAGLKSPELLLSFRDRLLQNRHSLSVSAGEIRSVIQRDRTARYIYEQSEKDMERINREIKDIEAGMLEIIESSENLKENYKPVTSVRGIAMIGYGSHPGGHSKFYLFCRQFACYAGPAPFGSQSGTLINVAPHVSHPADRKIKALLTQAGHQARYRYWALLSAKKDRR
jgi:transposase